MKGYPTKFKCFQRKIVQMEALQKLQNSIQTLIIFWPVYPIHTNSLFWVTFEEQPFCHFPPPNTSIRGKDSNSVYLSFEHLSFSNKRKTTILFPSPLTFLQWPMRQSFSDHTFSDSPWARATQMYQFKGPTESGTDLKLVRR